MVVVLRVELGTQLSLAQKESAEAWKKVEKGNYAKGAPATPEDKAWVRARGRQRRLQNVIHALGALQLADIEDKEL